MRRTKLVCTLGPACEAEETLREMIKSGMNVARFNFSHGDFEEHGGRLEKIKRIREEEGINVATLLDTKGPEIRTGKFKEKPTMLIKGSEVVIRHEDIVGDATEFSCTYKTLHEDVKPGDTIMIDDGLIELDVTEIVGKDVHATVRNEGPVSTYKGMNLPNIKTNLPALTDKDKEDLKFGVDNDYDFVAASFIRRASDVEEIRQFFADHGDTDIKIISKVENQEGVDNFEEILAASDGIMVARGDLGVEVPPEKVPAMQEYMVTRCREEGKICIVATQMLDSMQHNPRPTRAEVTDVANAVNQGTSAVMLSGESANGEYPVLSVQTLGKIAQETETEIDYDFEFETHVREYVPSIEASVAQSAVSSAFDLDADAIIAVTDDFNEVEKLAKFRSDAPIIVGTTNPRTRRQLGLVWNVTPVLVEEADVNDMYAAVTAEAESLELIASGSLVVEIRRSEGSDFLDSFRVAHHVVEGEELTGTGHGRSSAFGDVISTADEIDLEAVLEFANPVLVAKEFTADDLPLIRHAVALVQESDEVTDAVKVALNKNVPVVTGVKDASTILTTGDRVTVSSNGTVR